MTVRSRSPGMHSIRQEDESDSSPRSRSPVTFPTEYNQSFRSRYAPRPRNPVTGWQARNLSNILPETPDLPEERARPLRRRPENFPWPQRQESQIFPLLHYQNRANNNNADDTASRIDENNNIEVGRPRRRPQWPWQARAQTSSIFTSDVITTPPDLRIPQPTSASRSNSRSQWPWQERSRRSVIFDPISDPEVVKKENQPKQRKYDWDQRQSTSVTACVLQKDEEPSTSKKTSTTSSSSSSPSKSSSSQPNKNTNLKQWPWQKRARESVIFKAPEKTRNNREMKFAWDQRKSRFSVKLDTEATCPKSSSYSENFVEWQKVDKNLKPAGKPCYQDLDEDSQRNKRTGKRIKSRSQLQQKKLSSKPSVILSLPAPSDVETGSLNVSGENSSIRGATCLELVPADFDFKGEKNRKTKPTSSKSNSRSQSPFKKKEAQGHLETIPEENLTRNISPTSSYIKRGQESNVNENLTRIVSPTSTSIKISPERKRLLTKPDQNGNNM